MSGLLAGKAAVVTGGASGNGRAIVREFAAHGADVVVADRRETPREGGVPTSELIESETDARSRYVECDVSDVTDLEDAVDAAAAFGGIDVMVNNAAIDHPETFLEATEEEYRRIMDVNAKSCFFGSQSAARRMVERGGGSIINVGSTAAFRGSSNSVSYSTSKGAITLMTYSIASHLGPTGVRANVIQPGTVETRMTVDDLDMVKPEDEEYMEAFVSDIPLRRVGKPKDIANAAVFLASDLSSHVTAESLVVDGGQLHTA